VMAAGAAILLIVVVGILVAIVRRRRRSRALQAPLPLIPFSGSRVAGPPRPDNGQWRPPAAPAYDRTNGAAPTPTWAPPVTDGSGVRARSPYAPVPDVPVREFAHHPTPASAVAASGRPNDTLPGAAVDGASVRYWRPADGTLQFLPGRLEVVSGRDAGQEIRFVRTPGPDGTRVTFGRADGAPYRHVQLREATVSRNHARMSLEVVAGAPGPDGRPATGNVGRWRLENLSATNPVVVNGRPLAADEGDGSAVSLAEGDRIEMGEVVFRFHEK